MDPTTDHSDEIARFENDEPVALSRRAFLTSAALGGLGVMASGLNRDAVGALLAGKQPGDVQGIGVPKGLVRLAFNENPLGASPRAIESVFEHQSWMNRYDYTGNLLEDISKMHGLEIERFSGFDFKALGERHGIMLGVGTTELLQLLALAGLMPDGETIEAMPSYGQITRVGDELREAGYPVRSRRAPVRSDGNHDLEAMADMITDKTQLIIICNPHNPTGSLLPYDEVLKFIDDVPPNVMIAVDEVYIQFVRDPTYHDFIEVAKERENVTVLRTFSKAHGLGGMRVGYAVGHRNLMKRLA
ncbi:MAG: aminotransferase class I/II-fold pyridoxal phosphate-dependent enzyme, partial [Candidatus Latescibacteria bacterium]|nr:aminotransferase class I/II-fold pyridoxal phosphate-dependent enzyme [Candidatus Latescibacterota bacterium]